LETGAKNPRVLIVTPEVTYLPDRMGNMANCLTAKAGGLADVSAALIKALFDQGADVHIALPDYRTLFRDKLAPFLERERRQIRRVVPGDRVHLAEDRAFYYLNRVYGGGGIENAKLSLAFQREVINNIIPRVEPDLIHCNDWMTGLIPAMARRMGIPCLFTIHNIHTFKMTLAQIEDRGIDAGDFWQHLFFERPPQNYEESRSYNQVDFLISGLFAAHFSNVVSPTFLMEMVEGRHRFVSGMLQREMANKWQNGCATGILNAPDPAYNPQDDDYLAVPYGPETLAAGKRDNKLALQRLLGLPAEGEAPLFFWPSRLDPSQKGCQLLADIFYDLLSTYRDKKLQVVFVADGQFQDVFKDIVAFHGFEERVAICYFAEHLEHQAYAASDFILMPSLFEPCGLPQMIAPLYGSLPIAHDTGGIHDTIRDLDVQGNRGNGFLFNTYNSQGLWWAIGEAMAFFDLPAQTRTAQLKRIMRESAQSFTHAATASRYIELYEKMLDRPLVVNPV
jgi:starch synthase/alpha-amylase